MTPRHVLTGERLIIPPFPIVSFCYAIPENKPNTSRSDEKGKSFDVIYLRPNTSGSGHFVYNINTMQRNSAPRVVEFNVKPIPWSDLIVKTINAQVISDYQPEGLVIGDRNNKTTLDEFDKNIYKDIDDDDCKDKSYQTSDDSTINGDHDWEDENVEIEENQQEHFNVKIEEVDKNEDEDDELQ